MNKYDPDIYLKLNNFGYSDKSIADVKTYLATQTLPVSLNTSQKRTRFIQKWSKDWEVRSNKLIYTPLNLTVVSDGERNTVLKTIYEDIKQGVGQGIDLFYKRIRDKYLNIRRSDVSAFLKSQKVYQITRPQNHLINKPILALSPNERWGIDCINMVSYASANGGIDRGNKFILTVCDYFSRKTWLRPLISQTAVNVRNAMVNIVAETKTYPRIIQADNGSEFKAETSQWMKDNNITYIKTLSYSPESNGLVEGTNKKIRNVLREIMIRTNSRNWTTHLQTTVNLLNTQSNGTTKRTPDSIWKEGHELQGEQDRDTIRRHEQRIINAVKNNPTTEYKIGDFVRVKMGTLYSSVRKLLKSGDRKNVVVNYSPTVYKITNILRKDKPDRRVGNSTIEYEKSRYTLSNLDGSILQTQLKNNNPNAVRKSKRFFASDMQLVNDPEEEETYLQDFSIQDALKLNKMDKRNDIAVARALPRPAPIVRAVLPLPVSNARIPPVRPPPQVVPVVENYIGKEVENTFGGFGRRLFIGKIISYDKDSKKYTAKYSDGYEQEYTLAEIKKHLKREVVANVRPQRERRQVVIGGSIHYL
jgi:hypothetical protein